MADPNAKAGRDPLEVAAELGFKVPGFESPAPGSDEASSELTFSGFVTLISQMAMVYLGAVPDPSGQTPPESIATARIFIDGLALLCEKTRGNLDDEERRVLDTMLYQLRMLYVERQERG